MSQGPGGADLTRGGRARRHAAVLAAAADAARNTPGVAFLRPGLGDLLRGAVPRRAGRRTAPDDRVAGVRAERRAGADGGAEQWSLRVHLAVRSGHRALDVTRAVRDGVTAAVGAALAGDGAAPRVSVTVTVTDIT